MGIVVLSIPTIIYYNETQKIKTNGVPTVGTISRIEDGQCSEKCIYTYVEYYVGDALKENMLWRNYGYKLKVGEQYTIYYDKNNPDYILNTPEKSTLYFAIPFGLLFVFIALFNNDGFIVRARKNIKLKTYSQSNHNLKAF